MRYHHYPITWLCAAVVFVAGCSGAQPQGAVPGPLALKAKATQSALEPSFSLPHHLVYVGILGTGVAVYRERGSDQHRIALIKSGLHGATGLAVDANKNLYVGSAGEVVVYPRGSKTPSETLTNAGGPYGVAVGSNGTVYVANRGTKNAPPSILVYPKGQTTPSQTIPTQGEPWGVAVDASGNLYAVVAKAIYEFAPGSSNGKNLGLQGLAGGATGIAIDKHNDLLVEALGTNASMVLVFRPGRTRPSQKIGSAYRDLTDIAINRENTEIWVASLGGEVEGISYPGGKLLDLFQNKGGFTTGVAVSPASYE